jgi:dTDP-3-amino-3,4,6-trideoxy-alpha-D-glucose transaminase
VSEGVPFRDLRRDWAEIGTEIRTAVERVLASGRYVLEEEVDAFERAFAAACGARHCVGVGNGTDALSLTLRAWGIGPGDEVLVPALTAMATWMAVAGVGARPVPVDVDQRTLGMDPQSLEDAVSPSARAVIPVHLYGTPVDMDAVGAVARSHDLRVLEDAAHAHGARLNGRPVGTLGDAAAFSFYPTKNLGAVGDGGAIVTDDEALADRLRILRHYGSGERDQPALVGVNSRLDAVQAAVLRCKLAHLDEWNERRRATAHRYLDALSDVPGLTTPSCPDGADSVWHLFVVRSASRDELADNLRRRGIGSAVHYPLSAVDTVPFADWGARGAAPRARRAADSVLSLPCHPHLTITDEHRVIESVRDAVPTPDHSRIA